MVMEHLKLDRAVAEESYDLVRYAYSPDGTIGEQGFPAGVGAATRYRTAQGESGIAYERFFHLETGTETAQSRGILEVVEKVFRIIFQEVCEQMRLSERIAIVTGSGNGIVKAIAAGLAHEGAKVVIAELQFDRAKETEQEIVSSGGVAKAIAFVFFANNHASANAPANTIMLSQETGLKSMPPEKILGKFPDLVHKTDERQEPTA